MKNQTNAASWIYPLFLLVISILTSIASPLPTFADSLILCGPTGVHEIDVAKAERGEIEYLWSWQAKDHQELPESFRQRLSFPVDCKPIDGGAKILIASSKRASALVERPSGRVLWYAMTPNAHSLELLPRNRVVVACSTHELGNLLLVFDLSRSNHRLWETSFPAAHGVVWNARRQRLWALGYSELRCYSLLDWDSDTPSLKLEGKYALPDNGGHDLQAVPNGDDLVLSTNKHVYLFDREKKKYRLYPKLGNMDLIKCVSPHPKNGRVAYVQDKDNKWFDNEVGLLSPDGKFELPGKLFYKVRWLLEEKGKDEPKEHKTRPFRQPPS